MVHEREVTVAFDAANIVRTTTNGLIEVIDKKEIEDMRKTMLITKRRNRVITPLVLHYPPTL